MNRTSSHFDAVIIGSGFGGAVTALRLTQAGRTVLVLERGARYSPGTFPRDVTNVNKLFWRYPRQSRAHGLYDVRIFSGLAAVVASGVGGGSLIDANIHIRPDTGVFDDPRWPSTINRQTLDPYYDKVAAMLKIAPLPAARRLAKRDMFHEAARRTGHPIFDPDQAVSWTDPGQPGRQACQLVAQCEFGCPFGAKNTLDLTYLADAERQGAMIWPGKWVTYIGPASPKGYRVHYRDVHSGVRGYVTGTRVVVAAGTLGTNEILLRSRDVIHSLPRLSARLGHGYSANGNFLGTLQNSRTDLQPWHGTDATSVIRYFESAPQFTMVAPTFSREAMTVIATMGQSDGGVLRYAAPLLWRILDPLLPWPFRLGLLNVLARFPARGAHDPARLTTLFAIGCDNANGRLSLQRGRLDIEWNYAQENQELINKILHAMQEVTSVYAGTFAPFITWPVFRRTLTVHSLGGCHLAESPQRGVVSPQGEVYAYPGLFIADGSVIPTALGFHPAMTIAAIAEVIAEAVINSY